MNFRLFRDMLWAGSTLLCCTAIGSETSVMVSRECAQANSTVSGLIARGLLNDAQRSASEALTRDVSRLESVCGGLLSDNLAAGFQRAGRLDEARLFVEQAITYFQTSLPINSIAYLRPLQILAALDIDQGMTARAHEVLRKIQAIPATDPEDRILLLFLRGSLLQREGRWQEAEAQYLDALSAISDAGRQNSPDTWDLKMQLGTLYYQEHRYQDAANSFNSALKTLAPDAVPFFVRIKLLNAQAILLADEHRWREAELELGEAVSLCRQQPRIDSAALWPVLTNYAYVLHRLHRKEARSIEAWAGSLRAANTGNGQVIDVIELAMKRDRKQ